jgi:hypothetical protein
MNYMRHFFKNYKFILIFFGLVLLLLVFSFGKAQIQSRNPIIIVPGITGSCNWDVMISGIFTNKWHFCPFDHTWDNLIQTLENKGYQKDRDLFIAFYDWRKPNIESAFDYLMPAIDKALASSSTDKIDIIAHRMGG